MIFFAMGLGIEFKQIQLWDILNSPEVAISSLLSVSPLSTVSSVHLTKEFLFTRIEIDNEYLRETRRFMFDCEMDLDTIENIGFFLH